MADLPGPLRRAFDRPTVRRASRFVRRVVASWKDDNAGGLAAEVAFFSLLSVFPGLLAVAAAVGWLDGLFGGDLLTRAERRVIEVLETFLSDHAEGTFDAVRAIFRQGSGGVFTLGVVAALWASSRGMAAVLRAFAAIYDFEDRRSAVQRRLLAIALAVGSMLVMAVMLAMLVLGPLLGAGRSVSRALGVDELYATLWEWVGIPIGFAVLVAWAVVMLHVAPHAHRGWRSHVAAAAVVGGGWLLVSLGFRAYLAVFGENPVFGVLGGALVVLLWFYLLSLALMIGAEVNAVLDSPEQAVMVRPSAEVEPLAASHDRARAG